MADAAIALLRHQIIIGAVLGIQVGVDIHLAHIVEQIEIKVIHTAFLQLFFKDFFRLAHVAQTVARKLGGQVEAVARILDQQLAHHQL